MADEHPHLTIGEVLALVRDEFPDVTISKIRFLESQGLIDPQRTASGYRKFYEDDVESLRWVLRQQRDNFLPLKVIKAKLAGGADATTQQHLWSDGEGDDAGSAPPQRAAGAAARATEPEVGDGDATAGEPQPSGADWLSELQEAPPGAAARRESKGRSRPEPAPASGVRFGRDEVLEVTGITSDSLTQMIEFGLVRPLEVGGEELFDPTAVAVVRAVAAFEQRGLEARHLRLFKNGAEREAGLIEQMILPLLKQRNPKARDAAVDQLAQLRGAGDELHRALIDQALRAHFA